MTSHQLKKYEYVNNMNNLDNWITVKIQLYYNETYLQIVI